MKSVIAVDLDGTLAHYDGWRGVENIGAPVPAMLNRVKGWIKDRQKVIIFTARVAESGALPHIERWLRDNGIPGLEITNIKGMDVTEFWDDRAVAVEKNTGRILGGADTSTTQKSWKDDLRETLTQSAR